MKAFMDKVVAFFKKLGVAIANTAKKVGAAIANGCKTAWNFVKKIQWNQPINPVIAWSVIGGVVAVSVILMLIFWL